MRTLSEALVDDINRWRYNSYQEAVRRVIFNSEEKVRKNEIQRGNMVNAVKSELR